MRLKGVYKKIHGKIKQISIPSGAIKSRPEDGTQRITEISIPSGAIKSRVQIINFLNLSIISIPSGAIKRLFF